MTGYPLEIFQDMCHFPFFAFKVNNIYAASINGAQLMTHTHSCHKTN